MAIFFCVAVLFDEIGFVRPYGDDRAIILSGFMVKKEASAVNDSIVNLEKILNQVYIAKTIMSIGCAVTSRLDKKAVESAIFYVEIGDCALNSKGSECI